MIALSEFQCYLQKICSRYEQWWTVDALTEIIAARQATFSFEQMVQTEDKKPGEKPQIVSLPILKGIQNYVESEHILLVGSPGVGKSTALLRCLVSFAKAELGKPEPRIPVLVRLKRYNVLSSSEDLSGMLTLIRDALKPPLRLKIPEVEELLFEKRLILLLDGLNEMPADTVRTQLKAFREECKDSEIPLICTTRELGSGDLGIKRRLEVQPPSPLEINRFLRECMPAQAQQVLQLLSRDNRELSRTPFVLWMLYHLFQETGAVVETLGEAFRQFFRSFKKYKEDAPVTDERRKAWNPWLEHLAFTMLNSPEPTDPGLKISDEQAEKVLAERFGDLQGASSRIEELLKYHLLERVSEREVSFHHQLIQEYYAAERLLQKLPKLLKKQPDQNYVPFQIDYLNYLKWTEPIALMLGLPEIEDQAIRVVELALDIDLILGSRLAGEVKTAFQPHTVASTMRKLASVVPEEPVWLKLELLERIGSKAVVSQLIHLLDHPSDRIRDNAYFTLLDIDPGAVPEQCRVREDSRRIQQLLEGVSESPETEELPPLAPQTVEKLVPNVRTIFNAWVSQKLSSGEVIEKLNPMLQDSDDQVQWSVVRVLGSLNSEAVIPSLLQVIEEPKSLVCKSAAWALGRLGFKSVIPKLIQIVKQHQNPHVRCSVVYALAIIGSEEVVPGFLHAMQDSDIRVCCAAIEASETIDSGAIVPGLLAVISHSAPHVRRIAAYNLRILSVKENIAKLLNETYLQTLVQRLDYPDIWVRWRIAFTLWNVASEEVIPLLRPKLDHQNPDVGLSVALVLGKFGCKDAVPGLIQLMNNSNLSEHPDIYEITRTAAYALGQVKDDVTAKHLPELLTLIPTQSGEDALRAISRIQAQCQFYNYEIYQQAQTKEKPKFTDAAYLVPPTHITQNFYGSVYGVAGNVEGHQNIRSHNNWQHEYSKQEEYERILSTLHQMALVMERNPETFCAIGEEALRDHFLVQLNGTYEGQATGETSNGRGKTDIIVRLKGENIFIGECKFWGGEAKLQETLEQLLGYTTLRDNQLGMLIFNRNKGFSAVLEKIPAIIRSHPSFFREANHSETQFRFVLKHPDDSECKLNLAVLVFNIPSNSR